MKLALLVFCCFLPSICSLDDTSFRIVGGDMAPIGIAPYMCGLRMIKNLFQGSQCGGSIISPKWVLTAAHCIEGSFRGIKILVGTNHFDDSSAPRKEKTRKWYDASQWYPHHHYNGHRIVNDVGLIEVRDKIEFNERVQPIKIASAEVPAGAMVRFTGWGKTSRLGGPSNILKILKKKILSTAECNRGGPRTDEHQLCTFVRFGHGICQGDSGGPLVYNNEVIGVASYVVNGCAGGYPDVFARVSHFNDWIKKITSL